MKINQDALIGDTGYSLDKLIPYILYEDSIGSKNNISLKDSLANYLVIDIVFRNTDGSYYFTERYYNPNGKSIHMHYDNIVSNTRYLFEKIYSCNDKSINKVSCRQYNASSNSYGTYDSFNIMKVIGYK